MASLISLTDVSLIYQHDKTPIISKMNLDINPGEIITIVGPNGGGKSSLVKMITGMIKPTSGKIIRQANLKIGYMPQKLNLNRMIHLRAIDFLKLQSEFTKERLNQIDQQLGINYLLSKELHNLSGGEMQRILLARALLNNPQLLVLDEPTQGVDVIGQAKFYSHLQDIQHYIGCAIVLVSHDLYTVLSNSDLVLCINRHLCCHGTPAQVTINPVFTAIFGEGYAKSVGLYKHQHNHVHHLDHSICNNDECNYSAINKVDN